MILCGLCVLYYLDRLEDMNVLSLPKFLLKREAMGHKFKMKIPLAPRRVLTVAFNRAQTWVRF